MGLVQALTDTPAVTGPAAVDFAENSDDAVATYAAADLVNDPVVWSVSGDDGAAFAIAGGVLEFVAVPDYEKPSDADADNVYAVTVTATDASTVTASVDAAVTVTDVNDPSIVVIMADDAGDEVFGAYGSTQYDTPRLDAIAASGVRFDNAFSKPVCTPSRVAIMTGNSNVRNYADWSTLLDDQYTFGDLFSDAGYATAIAGKWQLQGKAGRHTGSSAGRGFDTNCLWHTTLTNGNDTSQYWGPAVECDGSLIETESTDYGPDIFVDFLLDFIETNQSRPFFAYYPMVLPHQPFTLPPGASCGSDDSDQCRFEQMVNRVDLNVGRIYDKLNTLGLLDNTLVLFTADNGTDYRIVSYLNGEAVYGDKHMPTDNGTRVPLIAHVPGQTAGRVVEDLIDITDILPTVADAAGIEVSADQALDGVSFWEQLQGNSGTPREWIYTYYFPNPHRSLFDRPKRHPEISYVRGVRYKLYSTGDLFDVTTDPEELHALAVADIDSAAARTSLQAVLDSMPTRGERIAQDLDGYAPGGLLRPRKRPVLSDATVNRDELTLSYAGSVKTSPAPPVESFTVTVDGNAVEVSAVQVAAVEVSASGAGTSAVTLMLESEVVTGQVVTVSYVPGSIQIQHAKLATPAAPLSGVAVVNDTPPNEAPVFAAAGTARTITEGTAADTAVGSPVTASDVDDATLSYALAGTGASFFDIGEHTGQITVAEGIVLVAADRDQYTVTVQARDSAGATASIEVTISVTKRIIRGGGGGGGAAGAVDETPAQPDASEVFGDVGSGAYYEPAVTWMIANEITAGCSNSRFCPDGDVTREQFVTFLWRAAGQPAPQQQGSNSFADINVGSYADQAIGWAAQTGITAGCRSATDDEPARFCPNLPIDRAQASTMLHRMVGSPPAEPASFDDIAEDAYYAPAAAWMQQHAITAGCSPTTFCPRIIATRAHAAAFIHRTATTPQSWTPQTTPFATSTP